MSLSSAEDREETFQFKESPYAKISSEMNKSYKISREEIQKIMQERTTPQTQQFNTEPKASDLNAMMKKLSTKNVSSGSGSSGQNIQ